MPNARVFLDFAVEGQPLAVPASPTGRVMFELFADTVPKTAENFRALCTGAKGVNELGVPLWYKGSPMHRVINNFMVQGGDFTLRNGKGGESIYGPTFADEDLKREIDTEGLLCMANKGKNTNSSQFFISLRPCPHLKGKHVVFGRVVKGFEVILAMSKLPTDAKDHPLQLVTISHCGELERKAPPKPVQPPSPSPSASSRSRSRRRDDSRSRSRSRSRSLSPDRKRSKRSSSRRDRSDDEDEEKRRERKRSSRHKSSRSSSSRKKHRSSRRSEDEEKDRFLSPDLTAQQIADLEAQAKADEEAAQKQREEQDRAREERRREVEREKRRREEEIASHGGVVFKGRGRMKAPEGRGMRGW
ncbi:hypothetical protein JCM8547_002122 [Rhodosporidiobolus lusitaniae]